MAIKKLTLTQDHIMLVKNLKFEKFKFKNDSDLARFGWGIDQYNMFGGTFVLEEVAQITGHFDDFIPGTETSSTGREYPQDLENYMWNIYQYLMDNLEYIESLVHTYAIENGLTPGTYKCIDREKIWSKIE